MSSRKVALDGVRALAVGMVLLAHAFGGSFTGGVIGVDIFFVLSGYLITNLLAEEYQQHGRIDLRAFYVRRALRLFPPLACLLIAVALLPWPWQDPPGKWAAIAATAGYVANYVAAVDGNSFGNLSHCWSLAVEEQFYLIWPVALIFIFRRRMRPPVQTGILVLSFVVLRAVGHAVGVGTSGWLTSRADQLLIGACLALVMRRGLRVPAWAAWSGAAYLAVLFVARPHVAFFASSEMVGGLTVTAVAAACLIGYLAREAPSPLHVAAAWRPAVALGIVSYGVYLYHRPIFRMVNYLFVEHGWLGAKYSIVRVALEFSLTALAAWASWRWVEQPALRLKQRFARTDHGANKDADADPDPVAELRSTTRSGVYRFP